MSKLTTGRCFCGAVRFQFDQPPILARACWCRDCQYLASGNASINVFFRAESFRLTGEVSEYVSTADSGNAMRRRFCPRCGTPLFSDVPAESPYCRWIEELARRGVVAGCGDGKFCPSAPVSREQMAVFMLRTLDPAVDPPACGATTLYTDVPAGSGYCRWIEELTRRHVVTGCGDGVYCPRDAVTREQMAVFLSVTFSLFLYGA